MQNIFNIPLAWCTLFCMCCAHEGQTRQKLWWMLTARARSGCAPVTSATASSISRRIACRFCIAYSWHQAMSCAQRQADASPPQTAEKHAPPVCELVNWELQSSAAKMFL